jgi:hypothetical protein
MEFQDGCQRKANVQRIGTRQGKFGGQFIFERREWKQLFVVYWESASASELLQNVLFVTSNLLTGKQYILFVCVCARVCTTMQYIIYY